jgi:hypothetical protein
MNGHRRPDGLNHVELDAAAIVEGDAPDAAARVRTALEALIRWTELEVEARLEPITSNTTVVAGASGQTLLDEAEVRAHADRAMLLALPDRLSPPAISVICRRVAGG